jgi:hypothetical protein
MSAPLLLAAMLGPRPAQACGAFFHPPEALAESRSFEVLFEQREGEVQVDWRVIYQGDAEAFGWVVPFAGSFASLEDGDPALFDSLRALTDPQEDLEEVEPSGCADAKGGDGLNFDTGGGRGVEVVAQGFTGTYAYAVLEATDAAALEGWLEEHGWELGEASEAAAAYVAEGGWQFLALSLAVEGSAETQGRELPPVRLVYQGDALVWPARMAGAGMAAPTHTTLYVQGDQRASIAAGWGEAEVALVWDDGESPEYMRFEAWPEALEELGEDASFGVVWSGAREGGWLTRFETLAPASAYQAADVTFALDGGTDAAVHTLLSNRGGCAAPEGAAWVWLAPGLGLLAARRRRRAG